ncbi:MAG: cytochrome c-type biogenesis protein CcmH [Bdellovibrionales bacterium]|nr:cytochrome c-type biogenesis protein CcmH [Bdellovibrionales bacterium]
MKPVLHFQQLVLVLLLLTGGASSAFAQGQGGGSVAIDPKTEHELELIAQEISEETMSPFCPGRTISACPSSQARELRLQILRWLREGYSPLAVRNQLVTIYGDDVIGAPPHDGFGWVAWLAPAVFVVVCLGLIGIALKRLRRPTEPRPEPVVSPQMQERVTRALEERR